MIDYETALKKPFTDLRKLGIGCILNIVPIINLFVTGYIIKVAGKTMVGKPEMPEWEKWGRLFRNGVFATLIGIIYAIPLLLVTLAFLGVAYFIYLRNGVDVHLGLVGGWSFIVILLGIALAYFLPGALLNYSRKEIWGHAFQIKEILVKVWRKEYFIAWLFSALYAIVLGFVFSFIPNIAGVLSTQVGLGVAAQAKIVLASSNLSSAVSGYIIGVTGFTVLGSVWKK